MASIVIKLILALFLYLILPFAFVFLVIIGLYRWIVGNIISKGESGLGKMVVTMSSAPGSDSMYKLPTMTLYAVTSLEGKLNFEELLTEAENNVVMARDKNGKLLRPETRQYITKRYGYSFWKDDPDFNIRNHIKISTFDNGNKLWTPEIMAKAIKKELCRAFHPKRSPWELHVFYNYKDSPEDTPGTALALRIHHSLGDGFSLLNVIKDLCNMPPEPTISYHIPFYRNILIHIGIILFGPFQALSMLLDSNDKPVWKVDDSKMLRCYNTGVSPLIPLEKIKEIRRLTKASFQAVILECYTGALRRFMKEAGYDVPKKIHCVIPLPMINHPGRKLRNHFTACTVVLPAGNPDPIQRLDQIEASLKNGRTPLKLYSYHYFAKAAGLMFGFVFKKFVRIYCTVLSSNFPGPDVPMSIRGHRLRNIWFHCGMCRGSCGLGFLGLSSFANIRFVFQMDEALVASEKLRASLLADYFIKELDMLKSLYEV